MLADLTFDSTGETVLPKAVDGFAFLQCHICGRDLFICCTRCLEPLCDEHTDCNCPEAVTPPPSIQSRPALTISTCDSTSIPPSTPSTEEKVKKMEPPKKLLGGKEISTQTDWDPSVMFLRPPMGCKTCGDMTKLISISVQTEEVEKPVPKYVETARLKPAIVFGWNEKRKKMENIEVLDRKLFFHLALEAMFTNKGPNVLATLKGKAKVWLDKNRPEYDDEERFNVIGSCISPAMIPRDGERSAQLFLAHPDNVKALESAAKLMTKGEIARYREFSLKGWFGLKVLESLLPKGDVA